MSFYDDINEFNTMKKPKVKPDIKIKTYDTENNTRIKKNRTH